MSPNQTFSFLITYEAADLRFDILKKHARGMAGVLDEQLGEMDEARDQARRKLWQGLATCFEMNNHLDQDTQHAIGTTVCWLALNSDAAAENPDHTGFHLKIGPRPPKGGTKVLFLTGAPELSESFQTFEVRTVQHGRALDEVRIQYKQQLARARASAD